MVDYNEMKQRLMGLVYKLYEIENLEVGHDRDKAVKDSCDISIKWAI
ncbi:hypothetical protein [Vibrio marisflavi]|uniref:Uncharacterized protein n=1 Tax=Vibrio marisflavi CECT 7928 TaxID=634439 RepID=A0ABM9A072_9VIBR|nr:hypothetical protein [Vibrio marisflavi]CAH0536825.1 hypothetical protein VMF7928_00715 [Vibrio marisflavi CECT 7928]